MKKSTMIFLSVISAIMILLIPNNKVKADYSSPYTYSSRINGRWVDFTSQIIYDNVNNQVRFVFDNSYNRNDFVVDIVHDYFVVYWENSDFYILQSDYPMTKRGMYDIDNSNYNIYVAYVKNFNGGNILTQSTTLCTDNTGIPMNYNIREWKQIYTNFDIYYNDNSLYLEKNVEYNPTINITSDMACDLNNRDMEYVTIDFSSFNNSNYTYQYGIQKQAGAAVVWYDIAELINGTYSFNEYYNGTIIYGRVMNNDEEIAQSKYKINNDVLPTFRFTISSVLACPIPNYEGDPQAEIITIDFTNAYIEGYKYYYSYDARIFHELNVTSENLVQHINEYLYEQLYVHVYDENDNLILYSYKSVFEDERLGYVPADYEERHKPIINQGAACDLQGNEIINLTIDFSNVTKYVNEYNFDVVINGQHYGALPYYDMQLNENNYIPTFEVEIYLDTWRFYHYTITIGGLNSGENFEETYNNMINNGDWGKDLNVNDVNDMGDIVVQFLGAVGSFVAGFFDLLEIFFNRLNYWVRSFIVTIFIELVICKIIKGVRK